MSEANFDDPLAPNTPDSDTLANYVVRSGQLKPDEAAQLGFITEKEAELLKGDPRYKDQWKKYKSPYPSDASFGGGMLPHQDSDRLNNLRARLMSAKNEEEMLRIYNEANGLSPEPSESSELVKSSTLGRREQDSDSSRVVQIDRYSQVDVASITKYKDFQKVLGGLKEDFKALKKGEQLVFKVKSGDQTFTINILKGGGLSFKDPAFRLMFSEPVGEDRKESNKLFEDNMNRLAKSWLSPLARFMHTGIMA